MAQDPNFPVSTQRRPRIPLWLILLLVASLLGGGLGWFLLRPKPQPERPIASVAAVRAPIAQTVAATGRVVPNFEVEIKAKASGRIIKLPYDVSDVVQRNALLVQLDPIDERRAVGQASATLSGLESRTQQTRVNLSVAQRTLSTEIARARANIVAAEVRHQDAQAKARRLEVLLRSRYISQEEYETGRTSAAQATTDLENARVRLRELETQQLALQGQAEEVDIAAAQAQAQRVALANSQQRLNETRIFSPISGIVTSRPAQLGQIVASGISNVGGGTTLMTVADFSRIFVLAAVDESDIGLVREGQAVRITADAYPNQFFDGRVVRISPKGVIASNVVTFEVKIEVDSPNKKLLKLEMTTNVEIMIRQNPQAVVVPADAIAPREGQSVVQVLDAHGKPHPRPVVVGINNGSQAEILRGLTPGERVVLTEAAQGRSRWRRQATGQSSENRNRQGQMMMMRGLGGGGRR